MGRLHNRTLKKYHPNVLNRVPRVQRLNDNSKGKYKDQCEVHESCSAYQSESIIVDRLLSVSSLAVSVSVDFAPPTAIN